MSRRSTILRPPEHDGTSQSGRSLPALDPGHAPLDERGTAELLAFVQALASHVLYFEAGPDDAPAARGTWHDFVNHTELSAEEIAEFIADPERFDGERERWLSRPHFALLLTFLELLGHARDQLNDLTRRHLDFYYRQILRMQTRPAIPDRVAILAWPASGVDATLLPAGTELDAGRDDSGAERIYRTERDLLITRAQIDSMRSVYVDREITGIPDVRLERSLTAPEVLDGMLALALGEPGPGDEIRPWKEQPVDHALLAGLTDPLTFCEQHLFLEHHELRRLMRLVHRRRDADHEWDVINEYLGLSGNDAPADPRDFDANLASVVGELDFKADGLPQVADIDDLYAHRAEDDVRAYIDDKLAPIGYEAFAALMPIKLRIDAEWAEVNRMLENIGRRRLGRLVWHLSSDDPTAFETNLAEALGQGEGAETNHWPPPWPLHTTSIETYEAEIRALEDHLSMPVEQLLRLATFAQSLEGSSQAERLDWREVDRLLETAHREHVHAGRRAQLAEVRDGVDGDLAALDAVVSTVLGAGDEPIAWEAARSRLADHLSKGQLDLVDGFRRQLTERGAAHLLTWDDALRVLELAWASVEDRPEPVAVRVHWRNLYGYEDASAVLDEPDTPRWKTFGGVPSTAEDAPAAVSTLGWALSSPVLSLSEGTRTITLTLGLSPLGFDRDTLLRDLGLDPETMTPEELLAAVQGVLVVEVTTEDGFSELQIREVTLAPGDESRNYWTLSNTERNSEDDRPAVQLVLRADPTFAPITPRPDDPYRWPTLRLTLRQIGEGAKTTTRLEPFEGLVLTAVHCAIGVEGLTSLRLQHEDRALDPAKPYEPFGRRPAVGARFYVGHPELSRARLQALRFDVEWMGLPEEGLAAHYRNYPGISGGSSIQAQVSLVEHGLELPLGDRVALFEDQEDGTTAAARTLEVDDVPAAVQTSQPGFTYARQAGLASEGDVRSDARFLRWELTPRDLGHAAYPKLSAQKARELSLDIADAETEVQAPEEYEVNPPYSPTIKSLAVAYRTSVELDPSRPSAEDPLLHVHPFGLAPIDPEDATLLPRYEHAGELYIGLSDLRPPQNLSLLVQLAEGTSDPAIEPSPVTWSCLDGDRWRDLGDGSILYDSTRGLINSGTVELALPRVAPSTRLPGALYWLRVAIARDPGSVCDMVDVRPHAVLARLDPRGNGPEHYAQPLPVGSVKRLRRPNAEIASIEQPYTSFGGKPAEGAEALHTRVAERLRHKQRALTAWDYERLVLDRFPEIYKVKCLSAVGEAEPGRVEVIVIPDIRNALPGDAFAPRAAANLLADIEAFLADRCPADARPRVRNAEYIPVLVRLRVRFRSGQDPGFARARLQEDLLRFLAPWAYDEGEPTIGGRIYATSILDYVDRRDYVDHVADLELFVGNGRGDFDLLPPGAADYHVATERPDQVLVTARQHFIEDIPETGYQQDSFTGIDYMRIELDFIVG